MSKCPQFRFTPDFAFPPGEILDEYLEAAEMSQAELAQRTGLAPKTINQIIKGKAPLSHDTALRLERVFGRPAHFWSRQEANYSASIAYFEKNQS